MTAYENNTGKPHPLSAGIKTPSKRADSGGVPLTDYGAVLWYGPLSIGTPPKDFTGMTLSSGYRLPFDPVCIQWSLTLGAVISLFPQRIATRPAQGTQSMTHHLAPPRTTPGTIIRWDI
jgi:hypothetical protein